jgi:hypothetical protein
MWVLKICGSGYQRDSLAGDLIEQYQQPRTRMWVWRQIFIAVIVVRVLSVGYAIGRLTGATARIKRSRIGRLTAVFAMAALGAGALAWAGTTARASCNADSCANRPHQVIPCGAQSRHSAP